ncbi:ATP synthase E chain [Ostertagia ostertagi]
MNEGNESLSSKNSESNNENPDDQAEVSAKKRKMSEPSGIDIPSSSGEQSNSQLPSWVAGGSPARFVAPDELLKMSVAMDNLALVHEIAIDPNFSVSDVPSNPIQAAIKENMHRAYWDLLTEDLAKDPPDYTHAFNLLMEIKQIRCAVRWSRTAWMFHGIGRFIIDLLGRLCAPERDTIVEKLRHEEGIVEMIKGIFTLMDIMKDDLTNYVLSTNRAAVEEYSSKFEYKEFLKYLEKFPDGSIMTKEWIKLAYLEIRPSTSDDSQPDQKRERQHSEEPDDDEIVKTTSRGYLKLVESLNPVPYPETLRIDRLRYTALGLGILWGAFRLRQIREYHADIREWEHEKAVAKAYEDAQRKKWLSREEMRYF